MKLLPTYCNPLCIEDIPLGRHLDAVLTNSDETALPDYRSISDPSVVYHNGKWIMYPSYSVAYVSEDFIHWKHVDIGIPDLKYSPAVVNFRGKWYLNGHTMSELYVADDPLGPFTLCGHFEDIHGNEIKPLDACFLADGDRLYLYWCKCRAPKEDEDREVVVGTVGVELDPDKPWKLLSEPVWINEFEPNMTWQCHGEYNQNKRVGWIEGQWMMKIRGRYYLLYSGSGTQYSSYACGILYSDEGPLSGFKKQKNHDPLTEKRHGLMRGAGHGSIAEGPGGTYWTFYTSLFTFNHNFERRVCMDVLGIDEDGELYCPETTETPQYAPGVLEHPETENSAGLLPLTVRQRPRASSYVSGREPIYANDESVWTWWQPKNDDHDRWIVIPLAGITDYEISSARIIWRDVGMDSLNKTMPGPFKYILEYHSSDNAEWKTVVDASENTIDLCIDYRQFDTVRANAIRMRIVGTPQGIEPGLVDLTVFGKCAKMI